jgi:hypothetical protein
MTRISLENLAEFVHTLEGKTLFTSARKKPFTVAVTPTGFEYTPVSSGTPRTNGYKYIQGVLDHFHGVQSFQPGQYVDITRNASYLMTILEMYFSATILESNLSFSQAGIGNH